MDHERYGKTLEQVLANRPPSSGPMTAQEAANLINSDPDFPWNARVTGVDTPLALTPRINPDRRACAGCVGSNAAAELQARLVKSEAEVARLQRCMRSPLFASGKVFVDDTQTPNERAYDALMAEREKRKRAGREIGQMLRLNDWAMGMSRMRVRVASERADELQSKANGIPLLEDKIARLKAENLRLLNNEAPLRAGYLEACAERDELRKKQAGTFAQAQRNDEGAYEKLRQLLEQEKRGRAAKDQQLGVVDRELRSDDRPRKIVKRLRGYRIS